MSMASMTACGKVGCMCFREYTYNACESLLVIRPVLMKVEK